LNATSSSSSNDDSTTTLMLNEKQILNQTLTQKNDESGGASKQMIKQLRPKKVSVELSCFSNFILFFNKKVELM